MSDDSRREYRSVEAPEPIGPYSQAIGAAGLVFCSGQVALRDGALVGQDAASQCEVVLENLSAVLSAAGCTFRDVVKTTVYLVDMADFPAVNEVYARHFSAARPAPARATVAVAALPKGARVEIEAVAVQRG